jgi:hypothetical protein
VLTRAVVGNVRNLERDPAIHNRVDGQKYLPMGAFAQKSNDSESSDMDDSVASHFSDSFRPCPANCVLKIPIADHGRAR